MHLLFALILCTSIWCANSCNLQQMPLDAFKHYPDFDGLECYREGVVFESSRSSLLSCAAECANINTCFGFSYDDASENCIGCHGLTPYLRPGAVGNKGFTVDWIFMDEENEKGVFRVSTWEMDFDNSVEFCECQGSTIARIDSPLKAAFMEHLSWEYATVWIGLTDEGHEGVWTWVAGGDETYFTDWKIGNTSTQPDGGEQQNCAAILKGYGYRWADRKCSSKYRVLCQKPIMSV